MNNRIMSVCPYLDPGNTRVAVYERGREITYGELARGISYLSANILKTGVTPGSRIGLCFDNNVAFIYGYLAARRAACIPVLLSPGLPAEKLAYVLGDSRASGLLSDARTFRKIMSNSMGLKFAFLIDMDECLFSGPLAVHSFGDGISAMNIAIEGMGGKEKDTISLPSNIHEIASIIYTSGTTSRPKGVMLTETNLSLAVSAIVQHLGLSSEDTCLVTMSYAHCAGLLHMLAHLRVGAKIVAGEPTTLIGQFLSAIKRHQVSILPAVPSFYTLLLKHPKHKIGPYLQRIRAVESSSAMINSQLIGEIAELFPSATLYNTYGLTEAPRATYMTVKQTDPDTNLSVGVPMAEVEIHIVNQELQRCRPNEEGEIMISGSNVALGYWNNPEKTAAAFTPSGFRTGDIGYLNEKGLLFLKGRKDDMIKIGAEAVYPHEIEEVIGSYPGIVDVLACGVKDEIHEYAIHVSVVCRDTGIGEKDILDYCREKLEKHKVPSKITFCDAIAIEESGKPRRGRVSS